MTKDADLLADALEAFKCASEHEEHNRAAALDDIKFARLNQQWPEAIRRDRERDGRPCLTVNKLPAFIRQVVNDARQNKPSITVHPADSNADPETALVYEDLIRNIEYTSGADVAYDTALESAVGGGFGYFRINMDYAADDTFDKDIVIQRIANPFSVFGDPYSTAADSTDWNSAFVVDKMSRAAFKKQYKGAAEVDWDALGYTGLAHPWMEGDEVQVAEWWTREPVMRPIVLLSNGEVVGKTEYEANKALFDAVEATVVSERSVASHKVTQRIMSGAEVLETVPWAGRYIPIVPVYGDEVNLEGKRHFRSMIRDAKDPQRMFNYWRTTSTELVALAPRTPFIGPKGAFKTDVDKWSTANTDNHAYIEYDGSTAPQRQPFAGPPAGALQEALNASDDIKAIIGLYDASLGARSNETSGRAILARQKEGDVSTFHFIDNLSRAIRCAGIIILDLIPEAYTGERILRVMGKDGTPRTVQIGQRPDPELPPEPGMAPQPSEAQEDPRAEAAEMAKIYDLSAGKYDLTVEAGPSYTTQREAAAEQMMQLLQAFPQAAPVIGDLLAKNLDWPGADEIAERLQALQQHMMGGQQQGPDPQQQQQMQQGAQMIAQLQSQLQQMGQALEQAKQEAEFKDRELRIKEYSEQTKRMAVMTKANEPSHLPAEPSAANPY